MPKKRATKFTTVYELLVSFSGRKKRLVQHVEEKDRQRILNYLADDKTEHSFFELGGPEGNECLVNTAHIAKLNLLEYLAGLQLEAEPTYSEKESLRRLEEREESDEPVIIALWLRGDEAPELHYEVSYAEWVGVRLALCEKEKFIEFDDEDGEGVMYGVDHLDAVEMVDPVYITEEGVEKWLARYKSKTDATDDSAPADLNS